MNPDDATYPLYGLAVRCDRELSFWSTEADSQLDVATADLPDPDGLIHDMPDPGGQGRLRMWTEPAPTVEYDGWRFRLAPQRIDYQPVGAHRSPFDLVLERVVVPLHRLQFEPDFVALHGAAVVIDDASYVFVGPSGSGKSTTARLLAESKGTLATDDLAVVDTGTMRLLPGAHGVRSFEPVAGSEPVELYLGSPKRWYPLAGPPPDESPLRAIIRLDRGTSWRLERVRGASAGVTLLEHAFDLQDPPVVWRQRRMQNVMKVARRVPLLACTYPANAGEPRHATELFARATALLEDS